MKRLLFAALVLAAVGAHAQEVVLGGWALPEGAVMMTVGVQEWPATTRFADGTEFFVPSVRYDSIRTTIGTIREGRLMEVEQE